MEFTRSNDNGYRIFKKRKCEKIELQNELKSVFFVESESEMESEMESENVEFISDEIESEFDQDLIDDMDIDPDMDLRSVNENDYNDSYDLGYEDECYESFEI